MNSEAATYFPNALPDITEVHEPTCAPSSDTVRSNSESADCFANKGPVQEGSDEDLLSQVSVGSQEALCILFKRHGRSVRNVCYRILRDAAEAEDIRQEVFLYLFEKASLFRADKGSAASWIMQITYHRAIDRRRYLDFRQHYSFQDLDEERQPASNGGRLVEAIAGQALLGQLREQLSTEQQQTLELHFFEGYSFREIAEKTGQTLGNIRNHYYRGLERLRSCVYPRTRGMK